MPVINGGNGDDLIVGGVSDDIINAGNGSDVVFGGAGNDVIDGGNGSDVISGGAGNDVIIGGRGDDLLSGGADSDVFRFGSSFGNDVITDFNKFQDKIDFSGFTTAQLNAVIAGATNVLGGVKLSVGGNSVTILGINTSDLSVGGSGNVTCFLRDTLIRTREGDVAVQDLKIGSMVRDALGNDHRVKWVGKRAYSALFAANNKSVLPVQITAGAMGDNLPARDLYVSPEHAILIDGVYVPAGLLVNGVTIRQFVPSLVIEYFHVECDQEVLLVAEGLATESYSNHNNRQLFSNAQEYADLYGEDEYWPTDESGNGLRLYRTVRDGSALEAIRKKLMPADLLQQAA
jgi:hypothetical protein